MFTEDAQTLAQSLLVQHGLTDWHFAFDRSVRRFGSCQYQKRQITLSFKLTRMNGPDDVRNTILHEIAHALVGPGHGHDARWKQVAASIGAKPERCYDASIAAPEGRITVRCTHCQMTFTKHRMGKNLKRIQTAPETVWHASCGPKGRLEIVSIR